MRRSVVSAEYMAALGLWKDFYASVVDELEQCEFTEHMLRSKSRRERSMRAEPPLWVPEVRCPQKVITNLL